MPSLGGVGSAEVSSAGVSSAEVTGAEVRSAEVTSAEFSSAEVSSSRSRSNYTMPPMTAVASISTRALSSSNADTMTSVMAG